MQFKPVYVDNSYRAKLDFGSFNPPEREAIEPWTIWQAKTYKKLDKDGGDPAVWNALFGASNWLLDQLDNEQKLIFAKAYAVMQKLAVERMPTDGNRVEEEKLMKDIGNVFLHLVDELNIIPMLDEYSHKFIKMGDTSEIGKLPQHTAALTFMPDEMRRLIVVVLLCKLLAPIFGSLMNLMPDGVNAAGKSQQAPDRELRCVVVLKKLLEIHFQDLISKFQYYLRHTVNGCCQTDKAAAVFSGYTPSTRTDVIYANLLVRNFINIDLLYADSNIMRFCDSMARTLVNTQDTNSNQNQVKSRLAYGAGGDDAGNIAQMEVDSITTQKTMDVPFLVAAAIEPTIKRYCMDYEITKDEFNDCYNFFLKNPIHPTHLNQFVVCSFFGQDFGGGRGVLQLTGPDYLKLCCLLQMIVFTQGMVEFGHMLTAAPTTTLRTLETQEDTLMKLNYGNSFPFRNVKQKFAMSPASNDGREWDHKVESIVDDLLTKYYVYNTPPMIWDKLESEDWNGRRITNDVNIIVGMCMFIEKITEDLG